MLTCNNNIVFATNTSLVFALPGQSGPQVSVASMSSSKAAEMEHPPYNDMIADAIATLADRGGSSLIAIKKHIGSKYKLKDGWERKVRAGGILRFARPSKPFTIV
jgi:hypothetical protein